MSSKQNKNAQEALSPGWLTAGSVLFCVAVSAPIFTLNFLPDVRALDDTVRSSATVESQPLAEQADGRPDYPEIVLAETGSRLGERMGSLAKLIDAQGSAERSIEASAVRRMVLDAVSVDLESSVSVDMLDHLRVPVRDCDALDKASDGWLISDGPRINAALQSLSSGPSEFSHNRIAGPLARPFATSQPGMRVEYCPDLRRISAVEILPIGPVGEPEVVSVFAELPMHQVESLSSELLNANTEAGLIVLDKRPAPTQAVSNTAGLALALSIDQKTNAPRVRSYGQAIELSSTHSRPDLNDSGYRKGNIVSRTVERDSPDELITVTPQHRPLTQTVVVEPEVSHSQTTLLALHGDAYGISTDVTPAITTTHETQPVPGTPPNVLAEVSIVVDSSTGRGVVTWYESVETALNLDRSARWRTQLRLALIGHDPNGIDGIFGDGTRSAIASLQRAQSLAATGYLDEETLAVLKRKSQRRYARWLDLRAKRLAKRLANRAAQERVAASAPKQVRTAPAARRVPECARDSKGVIISNQSLGCDLSVLREGLDWLVGSSS